ncbi:MAG TPA: peptide-methionine (S)-S-oxide reductase MsrA [Candidatus Dojkabacteria bacterium]|nr:peptide-methionine (S)-S-oxide reductase MsrA [Candidatus Dojkabacteria bacterium]HRO65723.1 peptide-methionine (S)-S-oxide reductase MsrA [Candidatus Dojkabacteria bacterium]HRP36627.1 peptide-methionine (S)-S-oxide reductase MsrA [Candidatus Dojkabacteria bacterium]HRP51780.1 peptide-methionine (S)-S-oxide reductase MsrA [Candidatus Dojkabacteria bacterium]
MTTYHMSTIATFAGGCFWCTEAIFQHIDGVLKVTPGYSGGDIENPTYNQVSTGETGHAEAVQIEFDPIIVDFEHLLKVHFETHDPTTLNQQGNDIGTQYRSIVFYHNEKQLVIIIKVLKSLKFEKPIVTEVKKFEKFYEAEDYHKNYYNNHKNQPYCQIIITPKLEKVFGKND